MNQHWGGYENVQRPRSVPLPTEKSFYFQTQIEGEDMGGKELEIMKRSLVGWKMYSTVAMRWDLEDN